MIQAGAIYAISVSCFISDMNSLSVLLSLMLKAQYCNMTFLARVQM